MEKKELQQTPRQGRGGVRLGRGVSCWAAPRAGLSQRSEAETGVGSASATIQLPKGRCGAG